MIDSNTDIKAIIDQIVADKTFSLDAVSAISILRDEHEERAEKIKALTDRVAAEAKSNSELNEQITRLAGDAAMLKAQLDTMKAQAEDGVAARHDAKRHEAVAAAWKEAMQIVFRPGTMRETVYTSVPVAQGGGAPVITMPVTTTTERTGE